MKEIEEINQLWRGQLHVELETFEAISKSLKKVEDKLNELRACGERIQRLQKIPGVGPRLAETVVAFLDDPKRFENSKQVGCYVGLTPRQYQSGQTEHQGKISGQGNKALSNLLVEICWVSSHNLMGRRFKTERIYCENPNRGLSRSAQILDLTGLAS